MQRAFASAIAVILAASAYTQISTYELTDCAGFRMASLAGGGHLILAERRFGIDSSHAQVFMADDDWTVTPMAARRFQYPLWYLFDAAPSPSGIIASGHLTSGAIPQLHAVNADGSLAWAVGFNGMSNSQHRIAMLFADGAAHYGYTSQDGFFGSGVYRVEGEQTGSSFAFRLATVSGTQFRFYSGAPAETASNHVLGGSIRNTGTNDYDALLAHFSSAGATWMKRLDLGAPTSGIEQVSGVVRMSDGGYAWVLFASGIPARGYFLRTDANGAVLSGAVIEDPAGTYLSAVTQLSDGTFLLAGSTGNAARLYRLHGNGTLLWTKECTGCAFGGISRFHRDQQDNLIGIGNCSIHLLTPEGDACGYVGIVGTTATAYTPNFVDLAPVNNTAPTVSVTPLLLERSPVGGILPACGGSSVGGGPSTGNHGATCSSDRLGLARRTRRGERN
ncbi:MAG: hypothetical protein IPM46_10925 [Flavobacteriales bacterium]|nr:hypothetical protein [Flavobacteriales bacterium]